jgi:hypothetical protein
MKRRRAETVEPATFVPLEEIPAGARRVAERRSLGIVRAWSAAPHLTGLDLLTLAVSLYLQGVADGYAAAEHNSERNPER